MTTVRIVGLGPSARGASKDAPAEMWGLPWDPFFPRYTRLFEMHDRRVFEKRGQGYLDQLIGERYSPIYMHQAHTDIPYAAPYPIQSVIAQCGDYFNSSIAYMLALAITERFERIELYGVDMDPGSEEWHKERPCNEYLIGLAKGRGIDVWVHPDSHLLKPQLDVLYLNERQNYVGRYGKLD